NRKRNGHKPLLPPRAGILDMVAAVECVHNRYHAPGTRPEGKHQSKGKLESGTMVGDFLTRLLPQAVGTCGPTPRGVIRQARLRIMASGDQPRPRHEDERGRE